MFDLRPVGFENQNSRKSEKIAKKNIELKKIAKKIKKKLKRPRPRAKGRAGSGPF